MFFLNFLYILCIGFPNFRDMLCSHDCGRASYASHISSLQLSVALGFALLPEPPLRPLGLRHLPNVELVITLLPAALRLLPKVEVIRLQSAHFLEPFVRAWPPSPTQSGRGLNWLAFALQLEARHGVFSPRRVQSYPGSIVAEEHKVPGW